MQEQKSNIIDDLPPVPEGCPAPKTVEDIDKIQRSEFRRHYSGPHGRQFQVRVEEIYRRAEVKPAGTKE
jgi:hypothetical protein